jgi:hypothetical protein
MIRRWVMRHACMPIAMLLLLMRGCVRACVASCVIDTTI